MHTSRAGVTRRSFFASVSMLAVGASLAACGAGGTIAGLTPAQAVGDLVAMGNGLMGGLSQVPPGVLPVSVVNTVENDWSAAAAGASQLTPALAAAADAPLVQKVIDYLNAGLAVLAKPPVNALLPSPLNTAVAAAAVLLPPVEALVVQLFGASAITAPPPSGVAGVAAGATAEAALTALGVMARARLAAPQITTPAQARAALAALAQ